MRRVVVYAVEKLLRRDTELASLVEFVRRAYSTKLGNYSGDNVDHILRLLYDDDDDDDGRSSSVDNRSVPSPAGSDAVISGHYDGHLERDDDEMSTHDIAHGLHYASIAMLGVLVLEVGCLPFPLHLSIHA